MDNPPESLVSQIADVFMAKRDEPDQLKQVVRAVIMSDEFRNTFGEKIKPHYEMAVSAFRATNAQWPFSMEISDTRPVYWTTYSHLDRGYSDTRYLTVFQTIKKTG